MAFFKKSRLAEIERQEQSSPKHGVLLVDDEEANLKTLSFAFERHYQVFTATNGERALAMMKDPAVASKVQLVLSDQRMPKLSGVEFFKHLLDVAPSVIRILVTGYADMQSIIDSINKAHIYQFLLKPVDPDELLVTVRRALEAYDMRVELDAYHKGLEELVQKRTQQLELANEELRAEHRRLTRAQNQLVMQEKMAFLGTLTCGIAHELKNPLNFIMNFSSAMTDMCTDVLDEDNDAATVLDSTLDSTTGDSVREVLDSLHETAGRVLHHGRRANEIISTMGRLSSHTVSERELTDLNQLLTKYAHLTHKSMDQPIADMAIAFEEHYDDSVGEIPLSEASFGQLLACVITNSFESLVEKRTRIGASFEPRIRLTSARLGDEVEFKVWDNGEGIPETAQNQIFHPFFTTKVSPKNIGLGLSIAYDLVVQEYGGAIEIEAEAGQFSELTIRLPGPRTPF